MSFLFAIGGVCLKDTDSGIYIAASKGKQRKMKRPNGRRCWQLKPRNSVPNKQWLRGRPTGDGKTSVPDVKRRSEPAKKTRCVRRMNAEKGKSEKGNWRGLESRKRERNGRSPDDHIVQTCP